MEKNKIIEWINQKFFKDLMKNSATILSGSMAGSVIGLVSFTLTLKLLGSYNYGVFVVAQTYMEIFDALFNFQSWQAVIKYGSKAVVEKDDELLKKYIKLGFMFDLFSASLGALFSYLLAGIIGSYLNWDAVQILIARVYAIAIIFNLTGTPRGILRLLGKYKYMAFHRVIGSSFKLLLVGISYFLKLGFLDFSFVLIFAQVADYFILLFIFFVTIHRRGLNGWIRARIINAKGFIIFGIWTNLGAVISLPTGKLDKILIAKFLSYEAVSAFKILNQFSFIIRKLLNSLHVSLYPELSRKIANGEHRDSVKSGVKLGIIIFLIGLPVFLVFSFTVHFWFGYVFGAEFNKYIYLLIIFIGYKLLFASFIGVDSLFLSFGYVKEKFIITILTSVVYLSFILGIGRHWGLLGFLMADFLQGVVGVSSKVFLIYKRQIAVRGFHG